MIFTWLLTICLRCYLRKGTFYFKRAWPEQAIDVLEEEAARIVQNVMPNYDLVPKGIRGLRNLPTGNFFSFPAEVVRNYGNIWLQAGKELTSGNKV